MKQTKNNRTQRRRAVKRKGKKMKNLLRMYVLVMTLLCFALLGTLGLLTVGERNAHTVFGTKQETVRFDRTSFQELISFLPARE